MVAGEPRTVSVCPCCDSAEIWARTFAANSPLDEHRDDQYRCKDCGETFDEPEEREVERSGTDYNIAPGNAPVAKALEDADPENPGGEFQ